MTCAVVQVKFARLAAVLGGVLSGELARADSLFDRMESTRGPDVGREGSADVRRVQAIVGGSVARILRKAAARRRRCMEAAAGRWEAAEGVVGQRSARPVRGPPTNHGNRDHDEDLAVGSRRTETPVS